MINEENLGKQFYKSLINVLKVRIERRKQYGDTFMEDDEIFLRFQIENKLKRLKLQFENERISIDPQKRETAIDSLKDICNYSIFLLSKIENNEN